MSAPDSDDQEDPDDGLDAGPGDGLEDGTGDGTDDAAIISRLEDLVDGLMERIEEAEDLLLLATQGDDQFPAMAIAYDQKWSSGLFSPNIEPGSEGDSAETVSGEVSEDSGEDNGQ